MTPDLGRSLTMDRPRPPPQKGCDADAPNVADRYEDSLRWLPCLVHFIILFFFVNPLTFAGCCDIM